MRSERRNIPAPTEELSDRPETQSRIVRELWKLYYAFARHLYGRTHASAHRRAHTWVRPYVSYCAISHKQFNCNGLASLRGRLTSRSAGV